MKLTLSQDDLSVDGTKHKFVLRGCGLVRVQCNELLRSLRSCFEISLLVADRRASCAENLICRNTGSADIGDASKFIHSGCKGGSYVDSRKCSCLDVWIFLPLVRCDLSVLVCREFAIQFRAQAVGRIRNRWGGQSRLSAVARRAKAESVPTSRRPSVCRWAWRSGLCPFAKRSPKIRK